MKISYLVTLYNKSATIAAVVKQIITEIELFSPEDKGEIIIVDDGSTDDSFIIASKLQEQYPDLIKLYHQQNQGVIAATNKTMELTSGDWLRFVDADDLVIIGSTPYLAKLGDKYDAVAVLSSTSKHFLPQQIKEMADKKYDLEKKGEPYIVENAVKTSLKYTLAITSGILIKSTIAPLIKMDTSIRYAQDHYIIAFASYHGNILQSNCDSFLYCCGATDSLATNYLEMTASSFYIGLDVLGKNNWNKENNKFFANFSARRLARALRKQYGKMLFASAEFLYFFILMTILGRTNLFSFGYKITMIDRGYRIAIARKNNKKPEQLNYPPMLTRYYTLKNNT